jgi:hypothetical protein
MPQDSRREYHGLTGEIYAHPRPIAFEVLGDDGRKESGKKRYRSRDKKSEEEVERDRLMSGCYSSIRECVGYKKCAILTHHSRQPSWRSPRWLAAILQSVIDQISSS